MVLAFLALALATTRANASHNPPRAWDYALAAGLVAGYVGARFIPIPDQPRWRGGVLIDDAATSALGLESERARSAVSLASDVGLGALVLAPFAIETAAGRSAERPAWKPRELLGAANAILATGVATEVTKRVTARERPSADSRSPDDLKSFFSGHTSLAFTGAGFVCASRDVASWGGPWPCAATLAGASTVGLLRVVARRHWASDVLVGAGVGVASGYAFGHLSAAEPETSLVPTARATGGVTTHGLAWSFAF